MKRIETLKKKTLFDIIHCLKSSFREITVLYSRY